MPTKGHEAEHQLFQALHRHLIVVTKDPDLDRMKIDGLVVGVKIPSLFRITEVVVTQVTTRYDDREKMMLFLKQAKAVGAKRTAFVEIRSRDISEAAGQSSVAAFQNLIFNQEAPQHALVILKDDNFVIYDLEKAVAAYANYLAMREEGDLVGIINYWHWKDEPRPDEPEEDEEEITGWFPREKQREGHGFLAKQDGLRLTDPDGGGIPFFVSSKDIDPTLRRTLRTATNEDIVMVFFRDGGAKEGYTKKTAVDVRLISLPRPSGNLPTP